MCPDDQDLLVRLAVPDDKSALQIFLGRTLQHPLSDTVIAMQFEGGPILGALSFSKIYSTWEGRSIALNCMLIQDEASRIPLLNELTKMSTSWRCSRIDCQTADEQLISSLKAQGARNLTEEEKWHCWELGNLKQFVAVGGPVKQ